MHGNDTSLTQLEANSEVIVDAEETLFEETALTMASTFDKKNMITPVVQVLGPVSSTATRCRLNLRENWQKATWRTSFKQTKAAIKMGSNSGNSQKCTGTIYTTTYDLNTCGPLGLKGFHGQSLDTL